MKMILLIYSFIVLTSCASALKKKCENTNWHEYAHSVAMRGDRLDQDQFINNCRKEEVEINSATLDKGFKSGMKDYCRPQTAYDIGKNGGKLNKDFCDSNEFSVMIKKYQEGLNYYCSVDHSFELGASGKIYTGICSPENEKAWMPGYKKGRKQFLQLSIEQNKSKISQYDRELQLVNNELNRLTFQLSVLPKPEERYNYTTKKFEVEDAYEFQRQNLNREIQDANFRLRSQQKEKSEVIEETHQLEKELITLGV